jgi:hypothetical protein
MRAQAEENNPGGALARMPTRFNITISKRKAQTMTSSSTTKYPLLQEILAIKNLSLQATYTVRNLALIFGVSPRAIQQRVADGQITSRDLPGRARFLSEDIEEFLAASKKKGLRRAA